MTSIENSSKEKMVLAEPHFVRTGLKLSTVLRSKIREMSSDDTGSDARSKITNEAFVELEKLSDKVKYASTFLPVHDQRLYISVCYLAGM